MLLLLLFFIVFVAFVALVAFVVVLVACVGIVVFDAFAFCCIFDHVHAFLYAFVFRCCWCVCVAFVDFVSVCWFS